MINNKTILVTGCGRFIGSALIRYIIKDTPHRVVNIDVIKTICQILYKVQPNKIEGTTKYENLISFVNNRLGHYLKYAIDASKIFKTLRCSPDESFNTGILKTVEWYLSNIGWWEKLQDDRNKETVN